MHYKAGLSDHVWTLEEVVVLVDQRDLPPIEA
jgi:hypothetical protein